MPSQQLSTSGAGRPPEAQGSAQCTLSISVYNIYACWGWNRCTLLRLDVHSQLSGSHNTCSVVHGFAATGGRRTSTGHFTELHTDTRVDYVCVIRGRKTGVQLCLAATRPRGTNPRTCMSLFSAHALAAVTIALALASSYT